MNHQYFWFIFLEEKACNFKKPHVCLFYQLGLHRPKDLSELKGTKQKTEGMFKHSPVWKVLQNAWKVKTFFKKAFLLTS